MTKRRRIAVLGAGPAGITAAYILSKNPNVEVVVYEADFRVGGMAKSIDLWGQRVDLGPHRFFSDDPRVNSLWKEVMGNDYSMVNRLTRIYYDKKFYYYPLKIFNVLKNIGPLTALECLFSYFKEKLTPPIKNLETFESWVVSRFGRKLFEMFFKSYSEKLWGISCSDLDADFAAQRIKKLSLLEAVVNALKGGGTKHKTLVDEFAYPHEGSGEVYERMAQKVVQNGGTVYLSRPVKGLWTNGCGKVLGIEMMDGEYIGFDEVISSIPITNLVHSIRETPLEVREATLQLKFRNTILVYLEVEGANLFPDQWLYIHDPNLATGRVTNFRNWVPHLYGSKPHSIIALEYWCYDSDYRWKQEDHSLVELASEEILKTSLLENRKILQGKVLRVPRCYPVYAKGYKEKLSVVEAYLQSIEGLHVIGRYGAFKYNNQDHSILMGSLAAENILHKAKHNLWKINTDYEYQESELIEESGLGFKKTGT